MKGKKILFTILIGIVSALCVFGFVNKTPSSAVFAANNVDCFTMILEKDEQDINRTTTYIANKVVGKASGDGKYTLNTPNRVLSAEASTNFQVVGWKVVYEEQDNLTLFIDSENLTDNKKVITLTTKEGEPINAEISFTKSSQQVYNKSTFKLEKVFENITITPVFDHTYYQLGIEQNSFFKYLYGPVEIATDENLFYSAENVNGTETAYENAVIVKGSSANYYGTLYSDNGKYYTKHQTLQDSPTTRNVNYVFGTFKVGDHVETSFDVDVNADLKTSSNIDVIGARVEYARNEANYLSTEADATEKYSVVKDEWERTTKVIVDFNIKNSLAAVNTLRLTFHNLYLVELNVSLDGASAGDEIEEIFGTRKIENNKIEGNISINNFHSRNEEKTVFLVKRAVDNQNLSFSVLCASEIGTYIDKQYTYYVFNKMNESKVNKIQLPSIGSNTEISICYNSNCVNIDFECLEYVTKSNGQNSLEKFDGDVLSEFQMKRGESQIFSEQTLLDAGISNFGYEFVGYSLSNRVIDIDLASKDFTLNIDREKPESKTIYLIFKKIEYQIYFTNFNNEDVNLNSNYALASVGFNATNIYEQVQSKVFTQTDFTDEQKVVDGVLTTGINVKLGGTLSISFIKNKGFEILGFTCNLDEPIEYLSHENIEVNQEFIESNEDMMQSKMLVIYVVEKIETYTITYVIQPVEVENINVIMADISVENYPENAEINSFTDEYGNCVIEISELNNQQQITLMSKAKSVGEGEEMFYYMFNMFTADGVTRLSKQTEEDVNNIVTKAWHIENVEMSKTIYVVYSMPSTQLLVQADDVTKQSINFVLGITIEQENEQTQTGNEGLYEIASKTCIVTVNEVFGYELVSYEFNGVTIATSSYRITLDVKADYQNELILMFESIKYQFKFKQNGASGATEYVMFGSNDYVELTLDTDDAQLSDGENKFVSVVFNKPEGYYVESLTFGGSDYASIGVETNDIKNDAARGQFIFKISTQDFELVIERCSIQSGPIITVVANVEYKIYTYTIRIDREITNSQGANDIYVILPTFKVLSVASIQQRTIEKSIEFTNIPYGEKVKISLVREPSKGMGKTGFVQKSIYYANFETVNTETLIVNETFNDLIFEYRIYYKPVNISVEYNLNSGSVSTLVDGKESTSILLYNKLVVNARGNADIGYVFNSLSYEKLIYLEYGYSDETWANLKDELYIRNDAGDYVLNVDEDYDSSTIYYIREIQEVVVAADDIMGENALTVERFNFDLFNLTTDANGLTFKIKVEFILLQMSIKHEFKEESNVNNNSLTSRGVGENAVEFNIEDFAVLTIRKIGEDRQEIVINENGFVTFNDRITVEIQINRNAINLVDGKEYDLARGLKLQYVVVGSSAIGVNEIGLGKYTINFQVKDFFKDVVNGAISVEYTFRVVEFTVETTTIVEDSVDFYNNVKLTIDARTYGFSSQTVTNEENNGSVVVSQNLQYLAAGLAKIELSETYIKYFVVYGINLYVNGAKASEQDYERYYIKPEGDNAYRFKIIDNISIEFLIRPIITFNNNGPAYKKSFLHDNKGYALEAGQGLTCGSTAKNDLQVADFLVDSIMLTYYYYNNLGRKVELNKVVNAGKYYVDISVDIDEGEYSWLGTLDSLVDEGEVTLEILKKEIALSYDKQNIQQTSRPYTGNSDYSIENVYQWLILTDDKGFTVKIADIMNNINDTRFKMTKIESYISRDGKDSQVSDADETRYYNYYLYNFALLSNDFNNNFHLINSELIIKNFIQITRAELKLQNLQVYSKVYDGTTKAELVEGVKLGIIGIIPGDKVSIENLSNIRLNFEDAEVGTNKKVVVDATSAITGDSAHNYYVASSNVEGLTIYPQKISAEVEGRGIIELINNRGLEDKELVALIPIGAELKVVTFLKESNTYIEYYPQIRDRIRGRNEFVVGYQIVMMVGENIVPISNQLHLLIPSIEDLTGAFYLSEGETGEALSTTVGENLLIDLEPVNGELECVFLIHRKTLLTGWQIALIVIGGVTLIAGVIVTVILVRRHKKGKNAVHEKI